MSKLKWVVFLVIPIWLIFSAGSLLAVEYDLYTVRSGDNLWKLVGPNYPRVIEINGLNPCGTIYPGQKLKIPKGYLDKSPFKEKAGDCIAEKPVKRLVKILKPIEPCESVIFDVNPLTVTMTIDLVQNDIKLEPGEKIRAHTMTRNHRFGHEDDVVAIGKPTGDGKLVFKFDNLIASASDESYVERIWFTTNKGKGDWFGPPCSRFQKPDNNGNLAIQVTISSNSAEPINTDQFLDRATRSGTAPYVYREKKEEYYEN